MEQRELKVRATVAMTSVIPMRPGGAIEISRG
jgi:hypothetical protein